MLVFGNVKDQNRSLSEISLLLEGLKSWEEERNHGQITRRNHSAQFKAKVVLEAIASDKTSAERALKYDLYANQVVDQKPQLIDRSTQVFGGDPSILLVDLKIPHAKIGQLALENDFLAYKKYSCSSIVNVGGCK